MGKFQQQDHSSSLRIPDGSLQAFIFILGVFSVFAVIYCFCLAYSTRPRFRATIEA
jgi:hypothetical protein